MPESEASEESEFNEWGEKFANGVIVALAPGKRQRSPGPNGNKWCIVAYNKYGQDITTILPISKETGDKGAVQDFCDVHVRSTYGGRDLGSYEQNYAARVKHFTRVMPAEDFLE